MTHRILQESPFLSPERIRELLALLLEYARTIPIDLMDLLYRQIPDGYQVRQKYRQKLRRGKTRQVTGQDLVGRIEWNQRVEPFPQKWLQIEDSGQQISLTFFTHSGYGQERIVRQVAHFERGNFQPAMAEFLVARGPGGYIH